MLKSNMRGAEDEPQRSNPAVQSKFDRSHGMGLKAPHLSHPGEVAPMTGTKVAGHNEGGHKMPVDVTPKMGGHKVSHHAPEHLGSNMADGERMAKTPNAMMTDSIRSEK
jgi:hypothetical protein